MTMRPVLPCALLALLAGCMVGPNYAGPPVAGLKAVHAQGFLRAGDAPVTTAPPLARWWETLADPTLDDLETRALAANADIAVATARIQQARAALSQQRADLFPSVSTSSLYAHAHIAGLSFTGKGGSSDLNIYNNGFNASWEADLFGGQRRAEEAARATAQAYQANLADAQVSLTAAVAQAYLNIRDRQQRIALNARSLTLQEQMLSLTRQRFDQGAASRIDVERLTEQLESTRAQATPVNAELEAYLDQLAMLLGEEPGAVDAAIKAERPIPLPPAEVAISDPASLLRRRPDIRAAERTLAAETAKVGQAEAARFPTLKFMGIIGIGGSRPSNLTNIHNLTALVAPQLNWSFLDFGRNKAKVVQAQGVRLEAEAKYRSTVLAALQDAEDSLSRFHYGRTTVATLARAKVSADEAVTLSKERYDAGTATLITLLDAQRQAIAAEQTLASAEAELTGDYVAIQKSLGLGWSGPG